MALMHEMRVDTGNEMCQYTLRCEPKLHMITNLSFFFFSLNQELELMVDEKKQRQKIENLAIWFVLYLDLVFNVGVYGTIA